MNKFLDTAKQAALRFGEEEEGAQVVEYALVIALVSITLALALKAMNITFTQLGDRITACLSNAATGC